MIRLIIMVLQLKISEVRMIIISATAVFWFFTLGLFVGWVFGLLVKKEGIKLWANIVWGIFASLLTGCLGILFGFGDGLLFAMVYTLCILFIANVFHLHHEEDKSKGKEPHIRIVRKNRKYKM